MNTNLSSTKFSWFSAFILWSSGVCILAPHRPLYHNSLVLQYWTKHFLFARRIALKIWNFKYYIADNSGSAVWSLKCLRQRKEWGLGFESHSKHRCLLVFILCVVLVILLPKTSKRSALSSLHMNSNRQRQVPSSFVTAHSHVYEKLNVQEDMQEQIGPIWIYSCALLDISGFVWNGRFVPVLN
jgi:hypothetical protein